VPGAEVALATCQALPGSCPDDAHLVAALERAGLRATTAPWDSATRWADAGMVVIRATWDYYLRAEEFLAWIDRLEADGAQVWNPPAVLRWNSDKRYLDDLAGKGVRTVPTRRVARGDLQRLARILDEQGWEDVVVKPAVSAGAHATFRATRGEAPSQQDAFELLLQDSDVLVQPYVPAVQRGEWSFVFIDGAFTHAVVKKPARGDFRVQEKHGGTLARGEPSRAMVDEATAILERAGHGLLYGRVDAVVEDGSLTLMELEVLEPELFFRFDGDAAAKFAAAVGRRLRA
jgi:glutathione synthase/RimK-type ligase-like ATP-grasp enzyme